MIGNYFGGTLSVGIDTCGRLDCDNGDNGVYLIHNWEIVGRVYYKGKEQNNYDLRKMLFRINECQPKLEQLDKFQIDEFLKEGD